MKSDAFTIGILEIMSLIFLRLFDNTSLTFHQSFTGIKYGTVFNRDPFDNHSKKIVTCHVSCFSRKSIHHAGLTYISIAVCKLFNTLIIVYFYNLFFSFFSFLFTMFTFFYFRPDDAKFCICCLWPRAVAVDK